MRALSIADREAFERSILRRRWLNALHRMGIATVGDLRGTPDKRLLEIPMVGPKAVADIAEALRDPSRRFGISRVRVRQILDRDGW